MRSFCNAKAFQIFSIENIGIIQLLTFEILTKHITNDAVSFEQWDPGSYCCHPDVGVCIGVTFKSFTTKYFYVTGKEHEDNKFYDFLLPFMTCCPFKKESSLEERNLCLVQASCLKLGDICSDFLVLGRSFKLGFTFVYMFYTFQLLPELKIGRSLSLLGDYVSHVSL